MIIIILWGVFDLWERLLGFHEYGSVDSVSGHFRETMKKRERETASGDLGRVLDRAMENSR